jgi:hypothetical protein
MQAMANNLNAVAERQLDSMKKELTEKLKEILTGMGFPQPEQMKLLAQLIPATLPLLEELLRFQKVPQDKGKIGEEQLIKQLNDFYPEDDLEPLGKSGDTDLIAIPKFNGNIVSPILVESKKNHSGWQEAYVQEVRRHMRLRNEKLAILAVETMPKGGNCFMPRYCDEGAIIVSSIQNFYIAYGALRSVLIALAPFNNETLDVQKLLADKKIGEALQDAYQYQEKLRQIRACALKIEKNAKNIADNADEIDECLRRNLKELQNRINGAVKEIVKRGNSDTK